MNHINPAELSDINSGLESTETVSDEMSVDLYTYPVQFALVY